MVKIDFLSKLRPKPNRSPAKRVRFGKEEQRNERALTFEKSRSKRYDACSDVEVPPRFELGVELLQSSALPLGYGTILYRVCAFAGEYYLGKKRGKASLPAYKLSLPGRKHSL